MLVANNVVERKILEFFLANSDAALQAKVELEQRTVSGALAYACSEARKKAESGANVACFDENEVYSWCMHYFQDLDAKLAQSFTKQKPSAAVAASEKPLKQPAAAEKISEEDKKLTVAQYQKKHGKKEKPTLRVGEQLELFGGMFA